MQISVNAATNAFINATLNNEDIATRFIGDIKQSAQTANHGKWYLCNGQALSRSTHSALFAIIGTSFGVGDDSTTFTLPDARGRVLGTSGQGSGLTNRTAGQVVGTETETLTVRQIPSHDHPPSASAINQGIQFAGGGGGIFTNAYAGGSVNNGPNTGLRGGGASHNNMQPTLFIGNTFIYAGV